MEFKKYSSIENSYREKFVDRIKELYPNELFLVQEKVHGANFSVHGNNTNFEVKFAKRTAFIQQNEKFYDYQLLVRWLDDVMLRLFTNDYDKNNCKTVSIYGEIYGGNYPGIKTDVSQVQKGVLYSPNIEFIAFDMKVDGKYLSYHEFAGVMERYNIPYSRPIFYGSLDECLEYPNTYNSLIPLMHGLEPLKENICEGNVIRPINSLFLPNKERVILKNKNEKFTEKHKKKPKKSFKPKEHLAAHVVEIINEADVYVTENRLNNVLSKIGDITIKDYGKVLGAFSKDITDDFYKENPELISKIENNSQKKTVGQAINKKASRLLSKKWKSEILAKL